MPTSTKTCKNCGSEIDERASICANCGESTDKTDSSQDSAEKNSNTNKQNGNLNEEYNGFFIGAFIKLIGHLVAVSIIMGILQYGIDLVVFWQSLQLETESGGFTTFYWATFIAAFLIWIGIFIKWKISLKKEGVIE